MTIDGVNIDDSTDFARLAEDALRSRIGSSRSTTESALGWLFQAWPQLRGTAFADRIAVAIGDHVINGDRATKHAALLFFVTFPDAAAQTFAALERAFTDRSTVRGVLPPDGGSTDLEWWLLRAIASVAATGVPAAMRMIEQEALRSDGKTEPIMHTLIIADSDWFNHHRADIVRLHPSMNELIETIEQAK